MTKKEPGIKAKIFAERLNAGPLSDAEAGELEAWLAEDAGNSVEYRTALEAMPQHGENNLDVSGEIEGFYGPTASSGNSGRRWQFAVAAFLFGIMVSSVIFLNQQTPDPHHQTIPFYQTAIGERQDVQLPDGSVVTLNTNSRILVDFENDHRRVILDRGEVFFDVESDKNRPFTVDAGARTVTVLGTKFNVQLFPDELTVSVVEGAVALHGRDETISASDTVFANPAQFEADGAENDGQYRLEAGIRMTVSLGKSQFTAATTGNVDQFDSWRNGVLVFDDQPLHKVVRDINRYDQRDIFINDPTIANLRFSGVFQIERTDSILTAIAAILPIRVDEAGGRVIITGDTDS